MGGGGGGGGGGWPVATPDNISTCSYNFNRVIWGAGGCNPRQYQYMF